MYSMNYIGKFINNFREFYNEINTATLTGAIDVVVVEQPDGSFTCSPFHVRFGKLGVLRSRYKVVDIEINGEPLDIHMKLGESGEAFFVEELSPDEADDDVPPHLACSPIPTETGFASGLPSGFPSPLPAPNDEWTRRRANSEVLKRRPKETLTTTFAADDPLERERCTLDNQPPAPSEPLGALGFGFGSAPELPLVVSPPSPPSIPRTFKAETVESAQRKNVSSASSSEFRPIADETVEAAAAASAGSKQQQRRRRRRSLMKKKKEQQPPPPPQQQPQPQSQQQNRKGSNNNQTYQSGEASDTSTSAVWESALSIRLPEQTPPTSCSSEETTAQAQAPQAQAQEPIEDDLAKIQNASTEADFHFFSDTEILPRCRPGGKDSRPSSPVQSDTEFETTKRPGPGEGVVDESMASQSQQSWKWGELPSPPRLVESNAVPSNTSSDEETAKQREEAAAQKSILSDMFSFMKKTKRIRHNPEKGGIYLSELNIAELEPEVAALYFPTSYHRQSIPPPECSTTLRDEDTESGNGPSLPQSPHSVEGAIGGPKFVDSDFEEPKHSSFERKAFGEMAMSVCGGLSSAEGPSETNFRRHLVSFDEFIQNPKIIEDPNLVIRYDGQYYNWRTACPLVMSLVMFQQPLPKDVLKSLSLEYMPNRVASSVGANQTKSEGGVARGYSSWFYWRRSSSTTTEPKKMASEPTLQGEVASASASASMSAPILEMNSDLTENGDVAVKNEQNLIAPGGTGAGTKAVDVSAQEAGAENGPKDTLREEGYNGSNSSDSDDARNGSSKSLSIKIPIERRSYFQAPEKFRKTLRLTSEQIAQLNLREGTNEAVFSVTTAYQGTTRCKCNIYRWRYDDKIVISDIDGTITKSDVLGHILPIVGKDWAQSGVAQLFTKIQNNGYRLLYLSARAIGQARVTREYLRSIKQDDLSLPDGPLLLNPTSLMSAFHREVIEKKPEEFKISCLRDIQALFPSHCKPFYAGYGNKINDVWAYRAVGIPIFRIFTINHRGELKHELTQTFQSSYLNMSSIVDQMFPPLIEEVSEDYTNFVFWRDPIADACSEINVTLPCGPAAVENVKTSY